MQLRAICAMDWSSLSKYDQFFSHVGVDVTTISKCDDKLVVKVDWGCFWGVFLNSRFLCHTTMGIVGHPCRITTGCMESKKLWNVHGAFTVLRCAWCLFWEVMMVWRWWGVGSLSTLCIQVTWWHEVFRQWVAWSWILKMGEARKIKALERGGSL